MLILDIYHLNRNALRGAYATPYKHDGKKIRQTYLDCQREGIAYDPEAFVHNNFTPVAII